MQTTSLDYQLYVVHSICVPSAFKEIDVLVLVIYGLLDINELVSQMVILKVRVTLIICLTSRLYFVGLYTLFLYCANECAFLDAGRIVLADNQRAKASITVPSGRFCFLTSPLTFLHIKSMLLSFCLISRSFLGFWENMAQLTGSIPPPI